MHTHHPVALLGEPLRVAVHHEVHLCGREQRETLRGYVRVTRKAGAVLASTAHEHAPVAVDRRLVGGLRLTPRTSLRPVEQATAA